MPDNTTNADHIPLPGSTIKTVKIEPGSSFVANGKNYTVSDTFTIGRLEKVTLLEEELMILSDQQSCHNIMISAMKSINEYKPGEAYTLLYNKVESDRKNAKLLHYAIRVCTAYINCEGEDLAYLTDEQIAAKVQDWAVEGLDVRPFIIFAATVFSEHLTPYKQDIANILHQVRSVGEAQADTGPAIRTSKQANGERKQ